MIQRYKDISTIADSGFSDVGSKYESQVSLLFPGTGIMQLYVISSFDFNTVFLHAYSYPTFWSETKGKYVPYTIIV